MCTFWRSVGWGVDVYVLDERATDRKIQNAQYSMIVMGEKEGDASRASVVDRPVQCLQAESEHRLASVPTDKDKETRIPNKVIIYMCVTVNVINMMISIIAGYYM